MSVNGDDRNTPALLTTMSIRPYVAIAAATVASAPASSAMHSQLRRRAPVRPCRRSRRGDCLSRRRTGRSRRRPRSAARGAGAHVQRRAAAGPVTTATRTVESKLAHSLPASLTGLRPRRKSSTPWKHVAEARVGQLNHPPEANVPPSGCNVVPVMYDDKPEAGRRRRSRCQTASPSRPMGTETVR